MERQGEAMSRTIVIGDIHGCRAELERLLDACGAGADDRVISVGDLVAKGPDSAGVVRLFRGRGYEAVLGNHDAHVLGMLKLSPPDAERLRRPHHFEVAASLSAEDVSWLSALPLWIRIPSGTHGGEDVLVVHAGLMPGLPLTEQNRDHLLNLRSIRNDGSGSKRIEGAPWASLWPGPEFVVFGHDAIRGLQQHGHAVGLDAGCVYGGRLTALILPDRQFVSVKAAKSYLPFD
jgi:hypothetical protein